jgi:hypothetical protein
VVWDHETEGSNPSIQTIKGGKMRITMSELYEITTLVEEIECSGATVEQIRAKTALGNQYFLFYNKDTGEFSVEFPKNVHL